MQFIKWKGFILHNIITRKLSKSQLSAKPILQKINKYWNNNAVVDVNGVYKYGDIIYYSHRLAKSITALLPNSEESSKHIAVMCPNDASFVSSLFGCWLTGNVIVPLCKDHPKLQLEYFIKDSQSALIVTHESLLGKIEPIAGSMGIPCIVHEKMTPSLKVQNTDKSFLEESYEYQKCIENMENKNAMIVYTSGTTGPPKGVILTHRNFCSQVSALVTAWQWNPKDVLLHTLPLHHVHGVMNSLLCPLDVGATILMLPKFDAGNVWDNLLGLQTKNPRANLFFAVPTMYTKLLEKFQYVTEVRKIDKEKCKKICTENIRLMTCGSAALPEPLLLRWEEVTGHRLLERYGMSEIGMALSNPLKGTRIPGSVGNPLPDVEVGIARKNVSDYDILVYSDQWKTNVNAGYVGEPGDLLIKGPAVFSEYWNKPEATKNAFTANGWFITGDSAIYENSIYRILGRTSSEIIKSGGYKISALDIERQLLAYSDIVDCAVFGVPDDIWGEKIVAMVVTVCGKTITPLQLKEYCKEKMPPYSIPTEYKFVQEIPRNIMGKVNKKQLCSDYIKFCTN